MAVYTYKKEWNDVYVMTIDGVPKQVSEIYLGSNLVFKKLDTSPFLSLSPGTATISADGGTVNLTLTSNRDWTLTLIDVE